MFRRLPEPTFRWPLWFFSTSHGQVLPWKSMENLPAQKKKKPNVPPEDAAETFGRLRGSRMGKSEDD